MPRLLIFVLGFMVLFASELRAIGDDWLFDPFDADRLSWGDRRFIQMALSMNGDYVGMLDGDWGGSSQSALEVYANRELSSGYASYIDVGALVLGVIGRVSDEGWDYSYNRTLDISMLTPAGKTTPPKTSSSGNFVDFSMIGESLGYSLTIGDTSFTARLHEYTLEQISGRGEPYTVRKPRLVITSGETAAGKGFYTRSDWRKNGWVTVMLSADTQDRVLVTLVAGSIRNGRTPPLMFEPDGELVRIVRATVSALEESERKGDVPLPAAPDPNVASRKEPATDDGPRGSGTGFVVGENGEVLSNAHVVRGCAAITVDGLPATVRTSNDDFDLALIDTGSPRPDFATFAPGLAPLNSDVTVIGYPLSGLLGGLNVTRGAVSSLTGIGGDATRMQISAPVQPGNSGGPVVNARGAVVGVVVSKLDAQYLASKIGDIPQNVNFAIRGEIAKLFLSMHGVEPSIAVEEQALPPEELAARMKKVTTFIECH